MYVQPYVFFDGRCDEAIEFYKKAVGATVEMLVRFKDAPEMPKNENLKPGSENNVMHSSLKIGDSIVMATDGYAGGNPEFKGFALSLSVKSVAEAERSFNALAEGGKVTMPLGKTFWSERFGMLTDRFGVEWMINYIA